MSDNATVEIKKFDGKRDLRSEIISFHFGDFSGISPALSNSRRHKFDKLSLVLPGGDADYLAAYFFQDAEKIYPEMIIRGQFSSGTNGTQSRAIFTINQVKVHNYGTDKDGSGEFIFIFKMSFEKYSYVIDSTADVLK